MTITELIKGAPVLAPDDTIKRAASLIRSVDGSSLVVIQNGMIGGVVSEKAISAALAQSDDTEMALETPVRTIMDPGVSFINKGVSLKEAAQVFSASDADSLPVIDNYGSYYGMLYRTDVVGKMTYTLKLPSIAGMATPVGVYLTTGTASGGAGSLGLFLSGLTLGLVVLLSRAVSVGLLHWIGDITHIPIPIYLASPPIGKFNVYDIPYYISVVLHLVVFRTMMWASPLAGYHAAEHMTVHAIENGEVLTPETVGRMPRVHPRCGTNILTGISLFMMVTFYMRDRYALMIAALVAVMFWRDVGAWMQKYVTTRPPSRKQLESGIAAGNQLIKRFHEGSGYPPTGFNKLWRMGLIQNAAGLVLVSLLSDMIASYFHIFWLIQ